ncbi:flagellin N-terminal helical domain-containing protein [Gellertiella hungarica]|uniref:Flagellin n=1 Tax=Gellertiella hungarica TaxID=1572859 RepID=A0A7W6J3I9_9HYPH|nr:flagellin [Gellertiella hungarica]MBB4064124.1 flagellin [Gellertiella hungarica]
MSSILTNTAALAALSTLRSIDTNLENTQNNISSGERVGQASDNAAYWSIATTMKSDSHALSTVTDALGLGAAKVDAAYAGLDQAKTLLDQIKSKLLASMQPGVDKAKVNKEIAELKNQLLTTAQSSSFSTENWLYNGTTGAMGSRNMVGGFTRNTNNTISVQTITFDAATSVLLDKGDAGRGILTKGTGVNTAAGTSTTFFLMNISSSTAAAAGTEIILYATTTNDNITGMQSAVDAMLQTVIDVAGTLGAVKARVDTQNQFVKDLIQTIDKGIGRLVDADMNEESTRLKALQTQQQLGIQSLSIANNNSQMIMQLFRQ